MNDLAQNADNLYESFEEALAEADCEISASEFQGIFVGMISAGFESKSAHWDSLIIETANDGNMLTAESKIVAEKVFEQSQRALNDQDELALILTPNDEYPLIDRIEALSFWSQGFLLGFGLQYGDSKLTNLEVKESLKDIGEISQLELSMNESEDSQKDLLILVEHLKVAVKMIYLELVLKQQTINAISKGNEVYH